MCFFGIVSGRIFVMFGLILRDIFGLKKGSKIVLKNDQKRDPRFQDYLIPGPWTTGPEDDRRTGGDKLDWMTEDWSLYFAAW